MHSNATENYLLPQFQGTDKAEWIGDLNPAFEAIDTNLNIASLNASTASATASSASQSANSAQQTADTNASAIITQGNTIEVLQGRVTTNTEDIGDVETSISTINTALAGFTLWSGTQAQYDLLTKLPATLYFITE